MPNTDAHHDIVKKALKKDGWLTVKEQLPLTISTRTLWVDIKAEKASTNDIIVVEVKGFEKLRSPMDYLENVVGQYMVYRVILEQKNLNYPLFLAIPHEAYSNLFQEEIVKLIIDKLDIKLLVFDTNLEEIVLWKA